MYVNPGQVVDDMQIEVVVRESREITEVDAMTRVVDNDIYTGMECFVTLTHLKCDLHSCKIDFMIFFFYLHKT